MSLFDTIIPRRGSGSIKWDRRPDLDPFWVADMDFASPPCIIEALQKRVEHGVFGYAQAHEGLEEAILDYLARSHRASVSKNDLVHLGGLVPALSLAARAFGNPGEEVMICTPVYYPFLHVGKDAQLKTIAIDHVFENQQWRFDWEGMEKAVTPNTRIFILCNPQNPLGRVFSPEEILQVAEFCHRHSLILVSDEIHCDLVLDHQSNPHFSALRLPEKYRQNLITLQSPSKTYNIAGLGYAFAVIENDSLRRQFVATKGCTLPEINALAKITSLTWRLC